MNNIIYFASYTKENGGAPMCPPIKKIQGKTAYEILNDYGNKNEIPINLEVILKNIGISALPMDFTYLEEKMNKGHILGLVLSNNKNAVIYYSAHDTSHRQRFTIAHELGHICKHLRVDTTDYPYIDWRIDKQINNTIEENANIFAGELLIPLHKLKEEYLALGSYRSKDLAKRFGVSVNVMEKRLDYLKISYYNNEGQAVIYE